MNYIRHLNAFFSSIRSDNRLTSSHVSLYLALFQYWNFNRFQNPFPVYRDNMMQLSKIGSKNTYHKCIKQLHHLHYIFYHPPVSKFQPVRISIIRLDIKKEPDTFKQLDLFRAVSPSPQGEGFGVRCTDFDTGSVPYLTATSTDNDTGTVPDLGHNIKPNIKQERETPTHKIFKKNKKIQNAINEFAGVPKLIHSINHSGLQTVIPAPEPESFPQLPEIEHHFFNHNYPNEEAIKFYNHYKALGWKIQGKTPITDWKALSEKWMTNAKKWDTGAVIASAAKQSPAIELNFLYDSFLENKKIFHHIKPDHFKQLKLELSKETLQQAWQERISQVSGTNQHSLIELWKAYLTNDPNNTLVQKDHPNLITLAKRIAVLNHFHSLKQSGATTLSLPKGIPP